MNYTALFGRCVEAHRDDTALIRNAYLDRAVNGIMTPDCFGTDEYWEGK